MLFRVFCVGWMVFFWMLFIFGLLASGPGRLPSSTGKLALQVCVGRRDYLTIFGDDYETPDGTCLRDYIHVVDLAKGHVAGLKRFGQDKSPPRRGGGTRVLDVTPTRSACKSNSAAHLLLRRKVSTDTRPSVVPSP